MRQTVVVHEVEFATTSTSGHPPDVPVFRGGTGPRPNIDLALNQALYEALDDGIALDARR